MATKVLVGGKYQTRPGVYATIVSGVKNPANATSYGNLLIIDSGIGANFGGGSGINGYFKQGADSIYSFDNIEDFQAFVKGGELWNLAKPLFKPANNQPGISKLIYVKAATTTQAEMAWTLTNGSFTIQTRDEGLSANGALDATYNLSAGIGSKLVQVNVPPTVATFTTSTTQTSNSSRPQINKIVAAGINIGDVFTVTQAAQTITVTATSTLPADLYAAIVAAYNANSTLAAIATASVNAGVVITANANNTPFTQTSSATAAPASFVFQIFHSTYKGLDALNNVPYDGVTSANAVPIKLIESPVCKNVSDLISWFTSSTDFNAGFKLKAGSVATGAIVVGDIASNLTNGWKLASGATEAYNASDFDTVLTKINGLDYTHVLSTEFGAAATGTNNAKLVDFIQNSSKYDRLAIIAGGYDKSTRQTQSVATAAYFDTDKLIVVHGGVKKTSRGPNGFNVYSQLYHAAAITGRCLGLPPEVPVTLKSIGIDGVVDVLEDDDQEDLIEAGVMYSYFDTELGGVFVVGLDINTLQDNDYLINDNGSTYSWQLKRIEADLNKGIIFAGKKRFFDPNGLGGNRSTSSPDEVVVWAQGYLESRTARDGRSGLIVSYKDVAASINQDNLSLTYKFVGNTEIKAILSTGTIIEG